MKHLDSKSRLSLSRKFQLQIVHAQGKKSNLLQYLGNGRSRDHSASNMNGGLQVDVYSRSFKEESDGKTWFWSSTGPAAVVTQVLVQFVDLQPVTPIVQQVCNVD